ncbi:MAG: hypothetical protein WC627_02975 [Legionella sp.]|jgi:hypothetical protein
MPIKPMCKEALQALGAHNMAQYQPQHKIPWVQRNIHSGWPLLQVSLFLHVGSEIYEPYLGGGKCHFFYPSVLSLAKLIAQIPGKITLVNSYGVPLDAEFLNDKYIDKILDGFRAEHKKLGIKIRFGHSAYGKTLDIAVPVIDLAAEYEGSLNQAMADAFHFAKKSGGVLTDFANWNQELRYTAAEIINELNPNHAIFFEDQVYVDFGDLLKHYVKNEEVIKFFQQVFKVQEFMAFLPSVEITTTNTQEISPNPIIRHEQLHNSPSIPQTNSCQNTEINNSIQEKKLSLLYAIDRMQLYASKLTAEDINKSIKIVALAENLKNEVHNFCSELNHQDADVAGFKEKFKDMLHSQDRLMNEHRKIWKPIIANILIALTGFGLVALILKAGTNAAVALVTKKPISFNDSFFFAKTASQEKIEEIEACLKP